MKRMLVLCASLITVLALTTVARADVISPVGMVVVLAYRSWPIILVAALVIVTMLLLKRFKKK